MKAFELRIGNLVLYTFNAEPEVYPVSEITGSFVCLKAMGIIVSSFKYISPIPLTEDWLLKFGFTYDSGNLWLTIIKQGEFTFSLNDMRWCYEWGEWFPVKIEYVHQLQNLYFALTGEELTLTPSPG